MNSFDPHIHGILPLLAQQDSRMLVYCLWIGFGILAFLSMILIWTRWGQAKPLSKCIALSIFAHILLGGYAYGTRLIFSYSNADKDEPVAFSVIEEPDVPEEKPEAAKDNQPVEEKPWEKFADEKEQAPASVNHPKLTSHQAELPKRQEQKSPVDFQKHEINKSVATALTKSQAPTIDRASGFQIKRNPDSEVKPMKIADVKQPENRKMPLRNPEPKAPDVGKVTDTKVANSKLPSAPIQSTEITTQQRKEGLADQVAKQQAQIVPGPKELVDANTVPDPVYPNSFRQVSEGNNPQINQQPVGQPGVRRRLADGQPIPEIYQGRFGPKRSLIALPNGGAIDSQKAVEEALKWLSAQQSEDGRWDPSRFNSGNETNVYGHNRGGAGFHADSGITGLVILAYLGAGHTHLEGPYQKNVQKGLEYLIRTQNQDGSMYGQAGLFARTYCHGMALMAIAEAYSLTGDHRIKPFVEKGQQFTVSTQNEVTGGWRYRPGDDGDMSQFGWQVMALKSAELAGVPIPDKTKQLMIRFLKNYEKGKSGGLAAYRPAEKPSRTMTAEALFCRRLLGLDVTPAASSEAIAFVMQELPADGGIDNLYYWYYATLAIHQEKSNLAFQEANWKRWNQALSKRLMKLQVAKNKQQGSFSNKTLWSAYGGTIYSTALSTLCLEASYRYRSVSKPAGRTARR